MNLEKKNKKNNKTIIILVLLLFFVTIGYALLTQNLNINGFSKLHNSTYDIHFDNIQVSDKSVSIGEGDSKAEIDLNDNTKVNFAVTLDKPGDLYEFDVDVVNTGSIDGMVSLITSTIKVGDNDPVPITDENLPNYLNFSATYSDGGAIQKNHELKSGNTETYRIKIEYKKDIIPEYLPSSDKNITIGIDVDYVQADDNSIEKPEYKECTYEGELVQGAEYINGQYTYRYMQEHDGTNWNNIETDGWGVILTDKESTDPVTTSLCKTINEKPIVSTSYMFYNSKTKSINTSSFNTSNVTNMTQMFAGTNRLERINVSNFDTSNVTTMNAMFKDAKSLKTIDLSNFNTSNVSDVSNIFNGDNSLVNVNIDNWDIRKINNNGESIFNGSNIKNVSARNLNIPESLTNWSYSTIERLDVTGWNLSNTTSIIGLFSNSSNLVELVGIDSWDTSNITNMSKLFINCDSLISIDLSSWNTSQVTNMSSMFKDSELLETIDLSNIDTSSVKNTDIMFSNCTNLETIYATSSFATGQITSSYEMFKNTNSIIGGRGTIYNVNRINKQYACLDGGESSPGYFSERPSIKITFDPNGGTITNRNRYYNVDDVLGELPTPSKNNAIFLGWYTEITSGVQINENTVVSTDTTYYAHWKDLDIYTIKFDPNKGVVDEAKRRVYEGNKIDTLPTPTREGYFFIGWFTEKENGTKIDSNLIVNENTTYYAHWKIPELVTITFDPNVEGMDNITKEVMEGELLGELPTPERTDYNLIGWYTGILDGIQIDADVLVEGAITYYARWQKKEAIFDTGTIVNAKMKNTANNSTNMPYSAADGAIKSIERSDDLPLDFTLTSNNNVASADSDYPIYIWHDNTTKTLYYYCEEEKVYLNSNSSYMFYYMYCLESAPDLSNLDASKVTDMSFMFYYVGFADTNFNIDLSNWDTTNVTNMSFMFFSAGYNSKSFTLNMNNWNVSRVANTNYMFTYLGYRSKKVDMNLKNWKTSNLSNREYMFHYIGLYVNELNVNLSNWDTSKVTDMSNLFYSVGERAYTINIDLSGWDTTNVTNMSYMFYYNGFLSNEYILKGLSNWNVSKVTDMNHMFACVGEYATKVSLGDLSNWNTSNVTDMSYMFNYSGYNSVSWTIGDLSGWNTSNVTNMSNMFGFAGYYSTYFYIGDLRGWDTSNVTNMSSMFAGAGYNSSTWRTLDFSNWDTTNVTDMNNMFNYSQSIKTIYASNKFVTNNVTNSTKMFNNSINLVGGQGTTYDPDKTDKTYAHIDEGTSNPGYFTERPSIKVTFDPTGGKLSLNNNYYYNIGDFLGELPTAKKEKHVFIGWFTERTGGIKINENTLVSENVTYYAHWRQAEKLTVTFNPNVEGMDNIIREVYEDSELGLLPVITRNDFNLLGWYTKRSGGKGISNITVPTSDTTYYARWEEKGAIMDTGSNVNSKMKNLANKKNNMSYNSIDTAIQHIVRSDSLPSGFSPSSNNNIASESSEYPIYIWFDSATGTINIYCEKNIIYLHSLSFNLFYEMEKLQSAPCISNFNTSHVSMMNDMFNKAGFNAPTFDLGDLSNWDTSRVINMNNMFNHAGSGAKTWTVGDLSNWDTSNVKDMSNMFYYAGTGATTWTVGDLSNWDTSSVYSMEMMFTRAGYKSTTLNLDLSNWDTSNVTDMSYMFDSVGYNATTWRIGNIGNWNTSRVTTMSDMLYNCKNLKTIDLSGWDTSNVTNMFSMFYNCTNLETIYVSNKFVTNKVTDSTSMFYNAPKLVGGQGTVYDRDHTDKNYAHIDEGPSNPGYFSERPPIKVTFNANGGIITNEYYYYNEGDTIGELPVPDNESSTFLGWYTNLIGGIQIDENTLVNDSVTYYAHWSNN